MCTHRQCLLVEFRLAKPQNSAWEDSKYIMSYYLEIVTKEESKGI
jgi:hypothetical protein